MQKKNSQGQTNPPASGRRITPTLDIDRTRQLDLIKQRRGGTDSSVISWAISELYTDLKKEHPDEFA